MIERLMTLNLQVHETLELEDGICKTRLTHPKLEGELFFVHSPKGGREDVLKGLDESPISAVYGLVSIVKELFDEKSTRPIADDPSVELSARNKTEQK